MRALSLSINYRFSAFIVELTIQGYYFSKPLGEEALLDFLEKSNKSDG